MMRMMPTGFWLYVKNVACSLSWHDENKTQKIYVCSMPMGFQQSQTRFRTCLFYPESGKQRSPAACSWYFVIVQSLSHVPTLWDLMDYSMPDFPVLHYLPEFAQTDVHWISDAIQPSHPLSLPSPPALNLSQHQRLFQWVGSSHQVAKVLEFKLQHQSFQWIFRTDIL